MHEAIHYNTIKRQGGKDFNDYVDFDAGGKDNPSILHARAKDELRAHLIDMIFRHHPKVSLMAVLNSRRKGYRLAADTIARALADYLRKHDPATYRALASGTLRIGDLGKKPIVNDDAIRHTAYGLFIRHRLWDL